jgi:hypothetical protein
MTTPPSLPTLPGLGWSRHKKPGFNTRIASHVSGREVRLALQVNPLYEFEAVFEGLSSAPAPAEALAGLGASSLQSLMGFFLKMQGQFGTFLYGDPDDNTVSGGAIATGDGATQSFIIPRVLGGFSEPCSWVTNVGNVYLNGVAQAPATWVFTAPNSIGFSTAPGTGVAITADFSFAFQCRFIDDQMDFDEFMAALWKLDSLKFRSIKANTVPAAPPQRTVLFLMSGTSWTVPSNLGAVLSVEVIGGGGGGGSGVSGTGCGGGGGAYAKLTNPSLSPGATVFYSIGAGGAGGVGGGTNAGAAGGDTWLNISGTNSAPTSTAQGVLAKGGQGGPFVTSGTQSAAGGAAASCIATTAYSGGSSGAFTVTSYASSGGGGAAGPGGAGAVGGASGSTSTAGGGGGGGGADYGGPGSAGTNASGGAGGNNAGGAGGGAGGANSAGSPGTNSPGYGGGGGGGGQGGSYAGGAGGSGVEWTQSSPSVTAGAGGGGGGGSGGGSADSGSGGGGGLYGGGGGGMGYYNSSSFAGGAGAQGLIVITFTT